MLSAKEICLAIVPGMTALLYFCLIEEAAGDKSSRKMGEQFPMKEGFSLPFINRKGENAMSGGQLGGCSGGLHGSKRKNKSRWRSEEQ